MWHLADVDPKRFIEQDDCVKVKVPLFKNDDNCNFEIVRKLDIFTPDMREDEFYEKMQNIFEKIPNEEKSEYFLYKALQTKKVLFWRTEEENQPWYFTEDGIKKIRKLESLKVFINSCKNKNFKLPENVKRKSKKDGEKEDKKDLDKEDKKEKKVDTMKKNKEIAIFIIKNNMDKLKRIVKTNK